MAYTITEACIGCTACVKKCPAGAISGEVKKLHRIDAAICVDCGVCGRICPQKSVLDQNGSQCISSKPSQWPKPVVDNKKCMSCNVCIEACPVSCLSLAEATARDPHGHPFLEKAAACISCGFCAVECPVDAITMQVPVAAK